MWLRLGMPSLYTQIQPGLQTNTHCFHGFKILIGYIVPCALSSHCYSALHPTQVHRFHVKGLFLSHVIQSHTFNVMCTVSFHLCLWVHYHGVHILFIISCPGCRKCCSIISTPNWGNNLRYKHWWFFSPSSSMTCMIVCVWLLHIIVYITGWRMSWVDGSIIWFSGKNLKRLYVYLTCTITDSQLVHYCCSPNACLFLCSLHQVLASSRKKILSYLRK